MTEKIKSAVWAEGQKNQMNRAFAFVLDLGKKQMGEICLSAASCYKVIADGKLMGFGPNRTAHGYARAAVYPFNAQYITVEVQSHFVPNFCWVKREPFFACVLKTESGKEYFAEDFNCFALSDRVQKVRRYSFQRGFCETYINEKDRTALYFCKPQNAFPRVKTEKAELPHLLPSETLNPALSEIFAEKVIDSGYCKTSPEIAVYVDRTETLIGTVIEGFKRGEWQDFSTDEISRITYLSGAKSGDYAYETLDFSRIVTGIVEVEIIAGNAGEVFFAFDEILSDEKLKTIKPFRGDTANVFKWTVKKAGVYNLSAFEPYAFRYANVITSAGVKANVKVRAYENPEAGKMLFECDDKKIERIMEAARHTFAHNAVDLLTDCPSRERAG